ncbi:hypothetical protein [Streptomyces sp. NPDC095613]|uniref:hypothetical protein n=1 Tax=Streptomyces sp. NPDC095613 TaxID=3155540 RepID=UPI00331E8110
MKATIGTDPYGHGSVEDKPGGGRDYREATIPSADAIVVYYVSTPDVLTVTAVSSISCSPGTSGPCPPLRAWNSSWR